MKACLITALLSGLLIASPSSAETGWGRLRVPGFWEAEYGGTIESHDGYAWYRCFVEVPVAWKGGTLSLSLGRIDDCDETYFNGNRIGGMGSLKPYRTASGMDRRYVVSPTQVNYGGYNLIAVRVWDGGGAGGISAGPLSLGGEAGSLVLNGKWEFRTDDDPAFSKWPRDKAGAQDSAVAVSFLRGAGKAFGKEPDYSPLAGTRALKMTGDMAAHVVAGADRFLLGELARSVQRRGRFWNRDKSSPEKYNASISANRARLAHILGVRDSRVPFDGPELIASTARPALAGKGKTFEAFAVRWPAFGDVNGEGLLLVPAGKPAVAHIIAIPDAGQTPEMIAGLSEGIDAGSQFARRLAESGCAVLIPTIINRDVSRRRLTNREFLYRSAFEMGRHLAGYEVQKVLAAVDWIVKDSGEKDPSIGVIGWGEGGFLALFAGALDTRIDAVCVSGSFDEREGVWQEPIDRNVFGLLEQFGDAELAAMVAPRGLTVEAARGPRVVVPPGTGGGPGKLGTPALARVRREFARAGRLVKGLESSRGLKLVLSGDGTGPFGSAPALESFLGQLHPGLELAADAGRATSQAAVDAASRHARQMHELDRHNQWLLRESPYVRNEFFRKVDYSSLEKYAQTIEPYREFFYDEVIGRCEYKLQPFNARSRKSHEGANWTGYEVVLDVFEGVVAYGLLLLPKDLRPGERRPVVVCQHGLEGRPQSVIGQRDFGPYKAFAASLANRGFITFAPQNLYIGQDRFRTLQRKANPVKKTLFSIIVPQHQQIVDWLETQPFVDPKRIAFYGLSYGGKTAMRVPPLVKEYCLSICSADFNEWVWKNASTRSRYSYVWTGEYEIFEFDLGSTFNYAEMARLIAPRPFMVERGHFDGVAPDETVAYEFAKVRFTYAARLGIGDRCELEWFVGPHTINGKGTFDFLHRHLDWPKK